MGEYIHYLNLDKKELVAIVPFKFAEQMMGEQPKALLWLITRTHNNMGLGWGDVSGFKYLGRWAGDRIIAVGDYDPEYSKYIDEFKDITPYVLREIVDYAIKNEMPELLTFMLESLDIHCWDYSRHNRKPIEPCRDIDELVKLYIKDQGTTD